MAPQTARIRAPAPGDEAGLAALMRAMEAHYGETVPPGRAEDLAASLCHGAGPGLCLVAAGNCAILGAAFFAPLFPGPALASVYFMKDLFVAEAARGDGLGRALMHAVAAHAHAHGIDRVEWTTGTANAQARRFYAALGATEAAKVSMRLEASALRRLAALDPGRETGDSSPRTSHEG